MSQAQQLRTGVTGVDCRRVPSYHPLWLSSTTRTSSICTLSTSDGALPSGWLKSLQCLPAQYKPCDPRRHMNRRSPLITLQNALQQVSLCMFLPKPATFMEFASDRLHNSAMRDQYPQMGPLPLGPRLSSQMRAGPHWAHVTDVRVWRCCGECSAAYNVLQHELRGTSCILPSAATSGTSTRIIVFLLKNSSSRS